MEFQWTHWAIFGIFMLFMEFAAPFRVMVWFGLGGLVVAFTLSIFPNIPFVFQLQVWIVGSALTTMAWAKLVKPPHQESLAAMPPSDALGQIGELIGNIDLPEKKAQIRFKKAVGDSDIWDCIADEALKTGTHVKVLSIEGRALKVVKIDE